MVQSKSAYRGAKECNNLALHDISRRPPPLTRRSFTWHGSPDALLLLVVATVAVISSCSWAPS